MSTTEQLSEIVQRVRDATKCLSADDGDLRSIAFEMLLEHELAHQGTSNGSVDHTVRPEQDVPAQLDDAYATPEMRAEAVARYFGIEVDEAEDVFDLSGEAPILQLQPNKIAPGKAEAVRQIALLVSGARTALGLETGSANIRQAADAYKRVDSNFMKHLMDFDDIAVRGKKSSANRLIRLRATGVEAASNLAQQLVSNGG